MPNNLQITFANGATINVRMPDGPEPSELAAAKFIFQSRVEMIVNGNIVMATRTGDLLARARLERESNDEDQRMIHLRTRVESLERAIDRIHAVLDKLQETVAAYDVVERIAHLWERVEGCERTIANLQTVSREVGTTLGRVHENTKNLASVLDALRTRFDAAENTIAGLVDGRVRIETNVRDLREKLERFLI